MLALLALGESAKMATAASSVKTAPAIRLNERRVWLLFGVVELAWFTGLGYVISLIA